MGKIYVLIIVGFLITSCKSKYDPYKEKSLNHVYNSLFCDNVDLYKSDTSIKKGYPWDIVLSDNFSASGLTKVADDSALETRPRLIAFNRLRNKGMLIEKKELLGVIIEVGINNQLDVVAAYKDGSALHIDKSSEMVKLKAKDSESDSLIKQLFNQSENVISNIGPWNEPRLPYPVKDTARITFLVSDGMYFGQGYLGTALKDSMTGPVFETGGRLIKLLMIKNENSSTLQ